MGNTCGGGCNPSSEGQITHRANGEELPSFSDRSKIQTVTMQNRQEAILNA